MMAGDFVVDRFQAIVDAFRPGRRRIPRSVKFSFLRAVANAGFRETTTYFIMEDVVRGVPIIYANYVGYDMVAHHAGPTSSDALGTLSGIDRQIKRIYRTTVKRAPNHVDLIILSDHGQSRSVPFRRLYKKSLSEFIGETLQRRTVERFGRTAELGYFHTLLSEIQLVDQAFGTKSTRRSRRTLERLSEKISDGVREDKEEEAFVVCASGNLAHVYFTQTAGRLTTEDLLKNHSTLLETLIDHPGIGFVVTVRENGEILMIGKKGMRRLKSGEIDGEDPMLPYMVGRNGEYTIRALSELASFPHSGDIIINGNLLENGLIVTFESQVGTHGGLGGAQTEPFIIFPKRLRNKRDQMQSPAEIHTFLSGILARGADRRRAEPEKTRKTSG
jgi:hypothetical protein